MAKLFSHFRVDEKERDRRTATQEPFLGFFTKVVESLISNTFSAVSIDQQINIAPIK